MSAGKFKLLYDGECPFCRREVAMIKRLDRQNNLIAEDIAAVGFDPAQYGLTRDEVNGVLHGIMPDGQRRPPRRSHPRSLSDRGLGLARRPDGLARRPLVLDGMYGVFARNRVRLGTFFGRKCESGKCAVAPAASHFKATESAVVHK